MASRQSRIVIPIYAPSYDGRYWGRYPNGDKPDTGALLEGAAQIAAAAGGDISTAIRLAAQGAGKAQGSAGMSSAIRLGAQAAARSSASAALDGGGQSGDLVHGEEFEFAVSGAGTRSVAVDIFDDCSNANVSTLWNNAVNVNYRTPAQAGRGVALPHDNISRYAYIRASEGTFSNGHFSYAYSLAKPYRIFAMNKRRYDPTWTFGASCNGDPSTDNDNNTKFATLSTGAGIFAEPNWYHDQTDQKCSIGNSWGNSFHSSGGLGALHTLWTGYQGGSGQQSNDPWYNWVNMEYRFGVASSGQPLKYLSNNVHFQNRSNQNTDDGSGTSRNWAMGNYSRQRGQNNNLFLADVVCVIGANAFKRLMLANHATYASVTITEFQPILSWQNGSIGVRVNMGRLLAGTVHAHWFDADDNPTYIGPYTISAS